MTSRIKRTLSELSCVLLEMIDADLQSDQCEWQHPNEDFSQAANINNDMR
jgi:hypothetical protein